MRSVGCYAMNEVRLLVSSELLDNPAVYECLRGDKLIMIIFCFEEIILYICR